MEVKVEVDGRLYLVFNREDMAAFRRIRVDRRISKGIDDAYINS